MRAVEEIKAKIEATNKEINRLWDELDKWPQPDRRLIESLIKEQQSRRDVLRKQLGEAMLDDDE